MKLAIFPYRIKFIGIALIILALPFAYWYFFQGKPDIFNIKIFAFVTTYSETRFFVWSQTNILDEMAAVLFISGLSCFSFSTEKEEKPHYEALRQKALVKSLHMSLILLIASFLVIYGVAIFVVCFLIFFLFLLIYNGLFQYYLIQDKKQKSVDLSNEI